VCIGTASITRLKTATAEAIFWQATVAFVIRARTTSLDPPSKGRPGNVALACIKSGVPSLFFSHYAPRRRNHERLAMKRALVAIIVLLFSTPIWAAEFYIMRDLTTQKCTVVDKRPVTAVKTITLASDAIYKTREDAESAMRAIKVCSPQK
jgi:hypothetical protein